VRSPAPAWAPGELVDLLRLLLDRSFEARHPADETQDQTGDRVGGAVRAPGDRFDKG